MYDATGSNAHVLVALKPEMVAIYLTGSGGIAWNTADVQLLPNVKTWVRIDQGGATSPQYKANVADVEPFAWTVANAESKFLVNCSAPRPTIYADRSDYKNITAKCDIWLAAPGLSDAQAIALAATDKRIVAVQNIWAGLYDRSIVVDPNWPAKAPVVVPPPPPPVATTDEFQVERYQAGFGWVLETSMKTEPGVKYRIRVSNGTWSDWTEISLP
jgi:hypothetical protein